MLQSFMRVRVSARSFFDMQATLCFPSRTNGLRSSVSPFDTNNKAMTIWNPYAAYLFIYIISGNGL